MDRRKVEMGKRESASCATTRRLAMDGGLAALTVSLLVYIGLLLFAAPLSLSV